MTTVRSEGPPQIEPKLMNRGAAWNLLRVIGVPVLAFGAFLVDGLLANWQDTLLKPRAFSYWPLFFLAIGSLCRALVTVAVVSVPLAYLYRKWASLCAVLVVSPIVLMEQPWAHWTRRYWLSNSLSLFEVVVLVLLAVAVTARVNATFQSSELR